MGLSKAPKTLRDYFYAWRLWTQAAEASGWSVLPANPRELALYLVQRAAERGKVGTVTRAIEAVNYVHALNGLAKPGLASLPQMVAEAVKRELGQPKQQRPPLETWMVREVVRLYCRDSAPWYQWVTGIGLLVGFAAAGRYDDLKEMRLDPTHCQFESTHVRLLLDKRKNRQHRADAQWLEIAASPGSDTCPVALLRRHVSRMGREGFLLRELVGGHHDNPYSWSLGQLGRPWDYEPFLRALRGALIHACGLPVEVAERYATHSMRRGCATTQLRQGLSESRVRQHAGVTSVTWCDTYNHPDTQQRLELTRILGL